MKIWIASVVGISIGAAAICASVVFGHSSGSEPLVGDEIAVYDAVLASWLGKEHRHQLVDQQLSAPPSSGDAEFKECTKGLDFPGASPAIQESKSLVSVQFKTNGIELVDGSNWRPADPGQGIAKGKSVESAVDDGFSHSLISFSQIAFSRSGRDALVKFGMACGSLCGSGSTIHLSKRAAKWAIVGRCGGWIS